MIDPYCIKFDVLTDYALSHPDPPALWLVCMTEEHVWRKIQVLKQEQKFNEVLRLKMLPPRKPQQQQGDQQGDQQDQLQGEQQSEQQASAPSVPQEGDGQQPSTSAEIVVQPQRR